MKLVILSVLLCLVALGQSVHVHPNGTSLVFSRGTNVVTADRRQCLNRIRKIESELNGMRGQLEIAQRWVREYPPIITALEQEMATQRLHLAMMDAMGVTNAPSAPVVMPPSPPALPLNASVQSGLPPSYRPEFIPRRDVLTSRE